MKTLLIAAGASLLLTALPVADAHAAEKQTRIQIVTENSGEEPVVLKFSSDQSFADLADGETRVVTGDDGDIVTVARAGDRLTITTSDGMDIDIPYLSGGKAHVEHRDGKHAHKNVRVIRKHKGEPSKDIMIVAPGGLSDYEKQVLRDAMTAAGIDKELHFVGEGIHADIDIEIETD